MARHKPTRTDTGHPKRETNRQSLAMGSHESTIEASTDGAPGLGRQALATNSNDQTTTEIDQRHT